ncbi:ABC transporter permease [Nakamurella alba]|uniref:ABC transporter permease n=1 Tax=Nakamurella alba TaxID=2665158 RepID=UPI0018ABB4A9|nr:ABC transporter permease [Nakamurella alba]
MTSAVVGIGAPPGTAGRGGPLTGLGPLLRLCLRRERIPLLCWVIGVGLVVGTSFPAIAALYPEAAARADLAIGVGSNPATVAITGPVFDSSVGGLSAWRVGVIGSTVLALMAVFTVVRRTRGDEEAGRTELLAATAVGRSAQLASAVLVAAAAAVAVGLLGLLGALSTGSAVTGSLLLVAALAGCSWVFAAVAALAAQLAGSARGATVLAGTAVGVAFLLRATADGSDLPWLRWLSPIGWVEQLQPFAANRWPVLLLYPAAAVLLLLPAAWYQRRRDLGAGLLPTRPGRAVGRLSGIGGLGVRLQWGSAAGWAVGLAVAGAVLGGVAGGADQLLQGSPQIQELFRRLGGDGGISAVVLAAIGGFVGIAVAGQAVSIALRLRAEEEAARTELLLSCPVSRTRLFAVQLLWVVVAPAVSLTLCGLSAGVALGARGGSGAGLGDGLSALLVQLPAVWVMGGIALLLVGLAPRAIGVAWAAVGVALLLGQLGDLLRLPRWVIDLSPFGHLPQLPSAAMDWTPVLVLTGIAAVLVIAGLLGFRRRDVG